MAAHEKGVIHRDLKPGNVMLTKGLKADVRSDLFSFGCILCEMLTGRRTFEGDSVSEVLASVLKTEPDFSHLPANANAGVRRLLGRCLAIPKHGTAYCE